MVGHVLLLPGFMLELMLANRWQRISSIKEFASIAGNHNTEAISAVFNVQQAHPILSISSSIIRSKKTAATTSSAGHTAWGR